MSAAPMPLTPAQAAPALVWLAQIFWGPDLEQCRDLRGALPALEDLAAALGPGRDAPARELAAWLAARPDPAAICRQLEPAHVALFIARPGGVAAPPYQSCYQGPGLLLGPPAQAMARRLEEAGLTLARAGEPPDHLAAELEYLAHLLAEPATLAQGLAFAAQELRPWLSELAGRLATQPGCPFYALAAALALAVIDRLEA